MYLPHHEKSDVDTFEDFTRISRAQGQTDNGRKVLLVDLLIIDKTYVEYLASHIDHWSDPKDISI